MKNVLQKGIDISSHQGMIDFEKVKQAGYSFVIVKAGQGLFPMKTFREWYLPAIEKAGLDWGAYWWSDAATVKEAGEEAKAFLKEMEGLRPTYPLWMDQEYGTPCVQTSNQQRTDMVKTFVDTLEDAGYYVGLYCSYDWLINWLKPEQLTRYDKWIAQYSDQCGYTGDYGMWQYTVIGTAGIKGRDYWTAGEVPGVKANCDLNYCYKDYPAIIRNRGLNGWGKPGDQSELDYKALYLEAREKMEQMKRILL